jgi:hypothetical protein
VFRCEDNGPNSCSRLLFLLPSLPKISCPTKETVTQTDVAFYFMPGAEQWYMCQSRLLWHPFTLTKLFDSLACLINSLSNWIILSLLVRSIILAH